MKFRTADLIQRLDTLVAQREAAVIEANKQAAAKIATARAEWLAKQGPAFVEFANKAKDKIRKGRPVTYADVPQVLRHRYGNEINLFTEPNVNADATAKVDDLLTLKAALLAIEDEYVTTTALREIGFRDIARLFRVTA